MSAATRRDYYEVLGVGRGATSEEIKRAYRSRAREIHPDVSREPGADAFAELNEAYRVLSRSSSRLLYDHFGYRGRGHGWFDERLTPGEVLGVLLKGTRRSDAVAEVEIEAEEARRGAVRTIEYWEGAPCPECGGDGAAPGAFVSTCPACAGTGRLRVDDELAGTRLLQLEACPECAGRGRLVSEPCGRCEGGGRVATARTAPVYIPAGTADGEAVPLDDEGVVLVRVRPGVRDSPLAQALAFAGFLASLAFLVYLLVAR